MRELINEEKQWLKVFTQDNEFFKSLLEFFERNDYLTDKQFDCLARDIYKAEEEGDTVLDNEDLTFLKENAGDNEDLMEILESYEDNGFLDEYEYNQLIHLKHEFTKEDKGDKDIEVQKPVEPKITKRYNKRDPDKTIIRIPCPHCNSLCSPQVKLCAKCGEPLPKLDKLNEYGKVSDIPNVDYTERNIIFALEKLIDKSIPLKEKFDTNSICYVKEGDDITGLSIFNCGLNTFPSEILRLKTIKNLALKRNNLNDLPKNIGFLSNLEWLDLRINKLERLPNAIGLLYKLKNLNLSSNNLTMIPDSIGDLLTLKKLNLSNNKLRNVPECIENLNCLENLNLKANYWISIPESIEKLKETGLQIIF